MDETTKEALSTIRSIISLPDQRDLGFPVDVVEKALEAATADNAALVDMLGEYRNAERAHGTAYERSVGEWRRVLERVEAALEQPHPGAPLLARLQPEALAEWLRATSERMTSWEEEAVNLRRYILGEEP